jgi:Xaa-Pro aminopeptidase
MIDGMPGVPRQDITWQDAVKTLPGVGAFKQKSTENALKVDFYELRDEVEKAKNTFDDIKRRSPEGLQDFIDNEKNYAKLALEKRVTKITDELSKIRRAIQQIAAAPEDRFSAQEKGERIEELREIERTLLKAVDVRGMREKAMM